MPRNRYSNLEMQRHEQLVTMLTCHFLKNLEFALLQGLLKCDYCT